MSILDTIEPSAAAQREPEIPLAIRTAATERAKQVYYEARARGVADGPAQDQARAAAVAFTSSAMEAMVRDDSTHGRTSQPVVEADRARAIADVQLLGAKGLALAPTLYTIGSRVVSDGVDRARELRAEFDRLPSTVDGCAQIVQRVTSERRADEATTLGGIQWHDDGTITIQGGPTDGPVRMASGATMTGRFGGSGSRVALSDRALSGIVSRIGCGGHRYLAECEAPLRAHNIREQIADRARGSEPLVLRTRNQNGQRVAFSAVSESYQPFDADKTAAAIALALPETRAAIKYDGDRLTCDALSHSTVQPERYVTGEVFRVGVRVSTDDTGSGAIKIDAVAFQNACLNLIIINVGALPVARIRHVGDERKLARAVAEGLRDARSAVAPFLARWNAACSEDLRARAESIATKTLPVGASDLMRGIFAGLLDGGLSLPGRPREATINDLVSAWERDHSSATATIATSRAAVVNAITRAAHEISFEDPFSSAELERTAAELLWPSRGRKDPAPLVYLDPELLGKRGDA